MKNKGLTLTEIMISTAIIGIIGAITIPAVSNLSSDAKEKICLQNLRAIDNAKIYWAVVENERDDAEPTVDDLIDYVRGNIPTTCVLTKVPYSIGSVATPATCLYHGDSVNGTPLHYKEEGYVFDQSGSGWVLEDPDAITALPLTYKTDTPPWPWSQ